MPGTIYTSHSPGTRYHLAVEETLIDTVPDDGWALLLWPSEEAVVIGKHQNPWAECRLAEMRADSVPLARRISGGGTVWHDPGNLNYAFVLPRDGYDRESVQGIACDAVRRLGIDAVIGDRQILEVRGRKVSGTAYCYRRRRVLHHGTLLLDADLDRLHRYLGPTERVETSRAIASVSSPVINLRELAPALTAEQLYGAFAAAAREAFGSAVAGDLQTLPADAIASVSERHGEWEWIYGNTPLFHLRAPCAPAGPGGELELEIYHGRIREARLESADAALAAIVRDALDEAAFDARAMSTALRRHAATAPELVALAEWAESRYPKTLTQPPPPTEYTR